MGFFKNVVKLCFFVWNIFNKTIVSIFAYLFNKIIRIINADHWALKRVTTRVLLAAKKSLSWLTSRAWRFFWLGWQWISSRHWCLANVLITKGHSSPLNRTFSLCRGRKEEEFTVLNAHTNYHSNGYPLRISKGCDLFRWTFWVVKSNTFAVW
jgi:hypothetical protein